MSIGTNRQATLTMSSALYLERAREYEAAGLLTLAKSARDTAKRLQKQGR